MQDDKFDNFNSDNPYELNDGNNTADNLTETDNSTAAANQAAEKKDENNPNNEPAESSKDESNQIGADIIRGHINTIILRALYERDKYGYEIINDIEAKSHGQYSLKQPTLYSALKRLENQGYIKAYWKTDEVSSGGRRKYFTLTENGKEITEKNLAEWEYSRTIIDSLISDRSFDFSQPAPTPVDFTILRNSVSRVPVVRSDEEGRSEQNSENPTSEKPDDEEHKQSVESAIRQAMENSGEEKSNIYDRQTEEHTVIEQTSERKNYEEQSEAYSRYIQSERIVQDYNEQKLQSEQSEQVAHNYVEPPAPPIAEQISSEEAARAEARRIAHENYMRLITEPVRQPEPVQEDIVPNSEKVNAERLIYNNRPETERDYKNLIDGIFRRAVTNGSVQTTYAPPKAPSVDPEPRVRLVDRGKADGVAVVSSNEAHSTYATKTTYNKGVTLLKCAAIVLGICVLESVLCFVFLSQLKTTWIYPTTILLIGLVQFTVFGILALKGYGKNCVRPTTHSYISSCVILTVIAILIISALSFLLNINFSLASDVVKMIVIPAITALNLTVFAVCFRAFLK